MFCQHSESAQEAVASVTDKESLELTAQVLLKQCEITKVMVSISGLRAYRAELLKDAVNTDESNIELITMLADNFASTDTRLGRLRYYRMRIESALADFIKEKKRANEHAAKIIADIKVNVDVVTERYAACGNIDSLKHHKDRVEGCKTELQKLLDYKIEDVGDGVVNMW